MLKPSIISLQLIFQAYQFFNFTSKIIYFALKIFQSFIHY